MTMKTQDELLVRVHREWDSWRSAEVRLSDLRDVHWLQPGHAPHPIVHAFVSCTSIVGGELPHNCEHGSGPHSVRVCVLKRHAIPVVYAELVRRAEEITRRAANVAPVASGAKRRFRLGF
jgi:hypothetical protein